MAIAAAGQVEPTVTMSPYGSPHRAPDGSAARARGAVRDVLRHWGMLTARWRVEPDYLIVGAKRGGTTSLARWLVDHPDVLPLFPARETRKGIYYFAPNYERGARWYRSHFPTRTAVAAQARRRGRPVAVGEASPYYLHHPHAPIRARRLAPAARIIILLRDPIERAHSHWTERTRAGVETLPFADALAAEPTRLGDAEERLAADPSFVHFGHQHYGYAAQSHYADAVARWLAAYPSDQVLVVRSEDLYDTPRKVYQHVLDHLGLPHHDLPEFAAHNRRGRPAIPDDGRYRLAGTFDDDIAALESLLGRSMDWGDDR
ncbi:MAG: sulfotransferase [Acidimicrobiales bacterium]